MVSLTGPITQRPVTVDYATAPGAVRMVDPILADQLERAVAIGPVEPHQSGR
jgi:hypothetical protein